MEGLLPCDVCIVQAQVLIATDAAGRVLELLLALERAWTGGRLPYPLALVTGGCVSRPVHDAAPGGGRYTGCLGRAVQSRRHEGCSCLRIQACGC